MPERQNIDEALRAWLTQAVHDSGLLQKQVADALGLPPSRLSEILSGKRRVSAAELMILMGLFGAPPIAKTETTTALRGVPVMGQIDDATWQRAAKWQEKMVTVPALIDERYPAERQAAFICDADAPEHDVKTGDYVIVYPYRTDAQLRPDDLVVFRSERAGLVNWRLGLRGKSGNGVKWRNAVTGDPISDEPDFLVIAITRRRR